MLVKKSARSASRHPRPRQELREDLAKVDSPLNDILNQVNKDESIFDAIRIGALPVEGRFRRLGLRQKSKPGGDQLHRET